MYAYICLCISVCVDIRMNILSVVINKEVEDTEDASFADKIAELKAEQEVYYMYLCVCMYVCIYNIVCIYIFLITGDLHTHILSIYLFCMIVYYVFMIYMYILCVHYFTYIYVSV
jgi:hypothetical protein